VVSRYTVIVLAFIAAAMRASQGAWIESSGLASLGAGLVCLRLAADRPALKPVAIALFVTTALSIAVVVIRQYS